MNHLRKGRDVALATVVWALAFFAASAVGAIVAMPFGYEGGVDSTASLIIGGVALVVSNLANISFYGWIKEMR